MRTAACCFDLTVMTLVLAVLFSQRLVYHRGRHIEQASMSSFRALGMFAGCIAAHAVNTRVRHQGFGDAG